MTGAELHTLTGAYSVHALPEEEREEFEAHLAQCESCRTEVRELTETASRLGLADARTTVPDGMKQRVMRRIGEVRQEPPAVSSHAARPASRRPRALPRLALAAALAAAAALGGVAVWQQQEAADARRELARTEQAADALARVLSAPDAQLTSGRLSGGGTATVASSRREDRAAFVAEGLAEPPRGSVYQLWYADGDSLRSAGLMDPARPGRAALLDGPLEDASGVGISVEPAGGSEQPTTTPLALLELPTGQE